LDWLPEWLFEGQLTVYAVLAVALAFLLMAWKQTPRRSYLVGCISLAALLGIYFLLDILVQTDREQIRHSVQEMSAGVKEHDVSRIFTQVSETYNRHGLNKAAFRSASEGVFNPQRLVDEMAVWGWDFAPDYKSKESASDARDNRAHVRFMAKPTGASGTSIYLVDAVMHRDSDGKWRLQSWEVFDAFHNDASPLKVPQVP
jgi:hypothetical protein